MDALGCNYLIKRPDYYMFAGCASAAELPPLVVALRAGITG